MVSFLGPCFPDFAADSFPYPDLMWLPIVAMLAVMVVRVAFSIYRWGIWRVVPLGASLLDFE
jgi:hypothetical protein